MADVRATDLTQETSATLNGTEQFVMFDAAEGKRCTVNDMSEYQRQKVGFMEHKNIRCNNTSATTEKAGFKYKQEVAWTNMTAGDFVLGVPASGTYNGIWQVESAAGKVILWFLTQPAASFYVNVYREVTTTV